MNTDRRTFLRAVMLGLMTTWCARKVSGKRDTGATESHPFGDSTSADPVPQTFENPKLLETHVVRTEDGQYVRSFSGECYPQNLEFYSESYGDTVKIHDLFPNRRDPFGVDTSLRLGVGGYNLSTPDRAVAGMIPAANDALWALNMVPFGVAIDGVIMDPSGPWYNGGDADPQNAFDSKCSGWEYDPIYKTVAELVGVPPEVRGHVQPGQGGKPGSKGLFHYHGYPYLMISNLKNFNKNTVKENQPLLVGYSADGYPVYDAEIPAQANQQNKRIYLFSGYILRQGTRTAVPHTNEGLIPTGTYDGTYVQDWEYNPEAKRSLIENELATKGSYMNLKRSDIAAGQATFQILDEKNGMTSHSIELNEYQQSIYFYVLTRDWPEIPRWFSYQPSESFATNIIPLARSTGHTGRQKLYDSCSSDLKSVHQWEGRDPY